jgi:ribosomal protein L15
LTIEERGDWGTLVSALNSYFHVEFEMRNAEEELLTRKQGNKESVRDFLSQLMFLARKAYGQDIAKREAAVLKRLELGLSSASLRRTYDDLMLVPGVSLSLLQAELVRRESRDDPERYQTFMAQERGAENAKKPQHPSAKSIAKELLAQQATESSQGEVNVAKENPKGEGARKTGGKASRGRGRGRGGSAGSGGAGRGRGAGGEAPEGACWKCGNSGHIRTRCPEASEKEIEAWKARHRQRLAEREAKQPTATGESCASKTPSAAKPAKVAPAQVSREETADESGNEAEG